MDAAGVLDLLRQRKPIEMRSAVVVAHPDDETVGAGASLRLFRDLTLVHVTDGAPRDMRDAHATGFETAEEYAAARRCELQAALQAAGAQALCITLGFSDQEASLHLPAIVATLRCILSGMAVVITHAYEGGHPDHDACAYAVHEAAHVPVVEFPLYHRAADGSWNLQAFPSGEPGLTLALEREEQARKRLALDCFTTQRHLLARFRPDMEVFRHAPAYDFQAPPHLGTLLYETFGWEMTGEHWRALAAAAAEDSIG